MNEHDSERIAGLLAAEGLARVERPEEAGILVYNTCSVRAKADTRLLGHLGVARRLRAGGRDPLVVVAGCLAQSRGEDLLAEQSCVDIVIGPDCLAELPDLLRQRVETGVRSAALVPAEHLFSADLPRVRPTCPTAWVQIMTGCNNFCSYCIVPYVRGPERSRPADDIVREVEALVSEGVREVTLLGQNVNAYGREEGAPSRVEFSELLWMLAEIPELERIRFMTSHPKDMSPYLIRALAECPPVCEHLHLPVQSGSDRILSAMRRGYTSVEYRRLVEKIRSAVPNIALTTDLIVGFPGETEEDFWETLRLVEDCAFDAAFTFVYSPRPYTRATTFPARVPEATAKQRVRELIALVQEQSLRANEKLVGTVQEVLVEGCGADGRPWGRTRGHKQLHVDPGADQNAQITLEALYARDAQKRQHAGDTGDACFLQPGALVPVRVDEATAATLRGRAVRQVATGR